MSSPTPTAITGKSVTFRFGDFDGTAQVTSGSISESAESTTTETLGGTVVQQKPVQAELSADFLYDGDQPGGGFYAALRAAMHAGEAGTLSITAAGSEWTGQAKVTDLSAEFPADDSLTCSASLLGVGLLGFTAPSAAPAKARATAGA